MKEMKYLEEQLEILNDQETNLNSYSMRINQLEALLIKNKIPFSNLTKLKKLKNNEDNNKNYLPYEGETNYNQFDNKPLVMISSEEKINDLRGIISEQEHKINYYDIMLKKLMNTVNHGKVNLN